ncbi:MAG: tRNA (adenosine(37)-N6)-threonylcarbamoyltransferase complex dimerization subunit type 1 TsaB [Candidatus Peregrinibacteria bacterium]
MLTLAINTASSNTAIALLENGKVLSENSWQSRNNEAEKLMPAIHRLLKSSHKTYKDIKKIIVIKGPGSFTGLRIGVTVANTIAYLNKCELFGINTFEYWWASAPKDISAALLIFAGSGGVYVNLSPKDKPKLVNLDKLNQYLKDKKITKVFGDISKEQKSALKTAKFIPKKIRLGQTIEKIIKSSTAKKLASVKIVEPYYIKQPAITKSKKPTF